MDGNLSKKEFKLQKGDLWLALNHLTTMVGELQSEEKWEPPDEHRERFGPFFGNYHQSDRYSDHHRGSRQVSTTITTLGTLFMKTKDVTRLYRDPSIQWQLPYRGFYWLVVRSGEILWCYGDNGIEEVKTGVYTYEGRDQVVANRDRQQKPLMRTWRKMRTLLRVLFTQYQNCHQGTRSITYYTEEFHRLFSRNNLQEIEDQLIARFVRGLKYNLQKKLAVHLADSLVESDEGRTRSVFGIFFETSGRKHQN